MTKYESLLVGPLARRVFNAHLAGFAYGYSLCIRFVYVGIVFFIGSLIYFIWVHSSKKIRTINYV